MIEVDHTILWRPIGDPNIVSVQAQLNRIRGDPLLGSRCCRDCTRIEDLGVGEIARRARRRQAKPSRRPELLQGSQQVQVRVRVVEVVLVDHHLMIGKLQFEFVSPTSIVEVAGDGVTALRDVTQEVRRAKNDVVALIKDVQNRE